MGSLRLALICTMGLVFAENISTDESSRIINTDNSLEVDTVSQINWAGEWTSWSKWSACSRSCGGGIIRQQRKCRRLPCRGRSVRHKLCNVQPCEERGTDPRGEQCSSFDGIPYRGELLKWSPYHDPNRPCSLICRGDTTSGEPSSGEMYAERLLERGENTLETRDDEKSVVVQLADKVEDGTKCHPDSDDVCVNGECVKVGCDLRVGSNKKLDACGVCGGDGSSCKDEYYWALVPISGCSKPCAGGFKMAMAVCKSRSSEEEVTHSRCQSVEKPDESLIPCNDHSCPTKWATGQWTDCSASCGGGTRTRPVFCSEENNETSTRLPERKCVGSHKPRHQETCNTISCPMWETNEWSECSTSCGTGMRTRMVTCKDGKGRLSQDCDVLEKPHSEQECRSSICPTPGQGDGDATRPLMQSYPPPPVPEKLIGQPIPSESTFIAEEWSPCSVTCGEGTRRREVHCKIFLEFSRTIAKLPDRQCSGSKPVEVEKCILEPCGLMGNSLSYGMDAVGDSGYAEPSLTDTYRSSAGGSSSTSYESSIRVAAGSTTHTSYSWKENGYTHCSASCLGGVQELIITCVRDSDGRVVTPYLCTPETRPESRIRTCNDNPCPPRWNFSEFAPCMSPCGLGIQTRDVTCIHEVARGGTNTVHVPNNMCPQPPPPDRRYCNILDCPVKWNVGEWGKCSKTCGGGVKKRYVMCEQIMAQGHQQPRDESDCPTRKPATQKPCNTRPCHDLEPGAQPVIYSQNTSFSQSDPNKKVDLKIGGTAIVFQGTSVVKIRCPVKKFDKAHIIWTKDRIELRKSKKYKINKKGALRIVDIGNADKGVYACIAGPTQAEVHLLVKARPGEFMSSEEILRHGKTAQHQDPSLDSAPALSSEILHTDHAAPAYGSPFSYNGEDFSHEAHTERAITLKPTKKPKRKKAKTSPYPPEATMVHGEYTVTSVHQSGYQESVESTATSGAGRHFPTLSRLISDLKAYWPFQVGTIGSRGHRMAPNFPEGNGAEELPTTRTLNDRRLVRDFVDDLDSEFGVLRRNTGIPDEKFGPDEERIIIDDDPYDLDEAIFALQNEEDPRSTQRMTTERRKPNPTKSAIDVIEESLRKAKRYETRVKNHRVTDEVEKPRVLDEFVTVVKRKGGDDARWRTETDSTPTESLVGTHDEHEEEEDVRTTVVPSLDNAQDPDPITVSSDNIDTVDSKSRMESSVDASPNTVTEGSDRSGDLTLPSVEIIRGVTIREEKSTQPLNHPENLPQDREMSDDTNEDPVELTKRGGNPEGEKSDVDNLTTKEPTKSQESAVTWKLFTSTAFDAENGDDHSTLQPVVILEKSLVEDMKFEWMTTDWSECSQTCGGGGFQMRGAQCTVRTAKLSPSGTQVSQKTAVGATLCEDAGLPVPEKVRSCGSGRCPQWHTGEWTSCETSRCFTWKTAMQRRDVTCRVFDEGDNSTESSATILDAANCDESVKPPQRLECYNDACKGVWKVGEWSECTATCGEDGLKYRLLQCVWFGTKKAAGSACRDVARPSVMKSCKGPPCVQTSAEDCKDLSQLCSRVKDMNMCRVPLYQKQCCQSCR